MKQAYEHIQRVGLAALCLALVVWSVTPSFSHAPAIFETIQDHLEMVEDHLEMVEDHLEMVEDHGHSHGFEEDLFWAMHGHSHDVVDHDHNQAFLTSGPGIAPEFHLGEAWRRLASANGPTRQFRIDRPPRA
ncbi:hypothetical protein [Ruegeria sp. HKCCD6109]|uniref:hypothetical protein n=1 Tax=Ruegeria sp. HKCCD6109 TaxID=2683017 RepID=UPI0014915B14|nr:hypothetical protein [Ruegeria sp. HKCCD6109]NOD65608.1 hypothetical protein [Ruegeria sp. HKCCD6109]